MEKLKKIFENRTTVLLLIVSLALILRIIRALEMNRYDVDCYTYFTMAINWAKYGAEYAYQYGVDYCPPLFPWLMSLGYKLGFQPDTTAFFIGIILGSLIPLCLYYIVNNLYTISPMTRIHNVGVHSLSCVSIKFKITDLALLAAFLGAIHPSLVRISVRCLRDSLYIPLVAIALVCAVAAIKSKSIFKWGLFSIVAALASFSRYEGPELILIFLTWIIIEIIINRKSFKENLKYYMFSIFVVVLIFIALTFFVNNSLSDTVYTSDYFYSRSGLEFL